MHLKHLQLHGYKTFASRTEFLFPSGITAIVGPNGSGKSNIADAIRWVLGEQSYNALRGKRTEDMIFSGSQNRPRAGMAEVALTLDNSEGWLPVEFSEVTISRRAFRDGQNEYRINNNRVRLRDVSELLAQSGLGRLNYTIIGQGLVDSVLALRAQERRQLFEEAAGIGHYRDKRADALQKLDQTRRNLERVHDIVTEIEPRLQRLKRQAERTQEYQGLASKLKQLLGVSYGHRWGQTIAALEQAQQIAEHRSQQYEKRAESVQRLSESIDRIRRMQSELRKQLGELHHHSSILHKQSEERQRELAVLGERSSRIRVQREEHITAIAAIEKRIAAQSEQVELATAKLEEAQQDLAQQEENTQRAQGALTVCMIEREQLVAERDLNAERLIALRAEIAEHDSRLETMAERIEQLSAGAKDSQREMNRLKDDLSSRLDQIARVESQLARLDEKLEQGQHALDDLEMRRTALMDQSRREQERLRQLREGEADVAARLDLLGQLRRDFAVYGQAVRALLFGSDRIPEDHSKGESAALVSHKNERYSPVLPGIKGVLAQMIQIARTGPSDISTAVEAALGAHASAIVVDNWRTAENALQYLKSRGEAGRVVLLALESPVEDSVPSQTDFSGPALSSFVRCEITLRPLVDRLLGRAFLTPNLGTAQSFLAELPRGTICVTPEGDVFGGDGVIEGGLSTAHSNPLAQEREWADLNSRRIEMGARREKLEVTIGELSIALDAVQDQLKHTRLALDELHGRRAATDTVNDKIAGQIDRIRQEISWRESAMANDARDEEMLRQQQAVILGELDELSQARAAAEDRIRELGSRLLALPADALSGQLTAAQLALATSRQAYKGQHDILQVRKTGLEQLNGEREALNQRLSALRDEERAAEERFAYIKNLQSATSSQLEALSQQIEPAEAGLETLEIEIGQTEADERVERARLREFESHLATARLNVQRREDSLAQLRDKIEEDLGLVELDLGPRFSGQSPLPLHPLVSKLPIVEQLPEGVEEEIKRLRSQLRRLGAINPVAPDEYKEMFERHSFLKAQSSDLIDASDSLRKIIAELDGLIEHAFRQTFEAVASEFSRIFTALFGGGQARLDLSDPDDLSQTGVEIVAQPPAKRLQALTSLSGGERALTAVALIFSILKVSPTPFCILDEVDAMLDEANIERFRTMLEWLAEFTQIAIITHNRGTISAADTVYGVSMGADSVSQVYSIRLQGEQVAEA